MVIHTLSDQQKTMSQISEKIRKNTKIMQRSDPDKNVKEKKKYAKLYISADRAKQIKTKAIVNEDPTEKLIRSSVITVLKYVDDYYK